MPESFIISGGKHLYNMNFCDYFTVKTSTITFSISSTFADIMPILKILADTNTCTLHWYRTEDLCCYEYRYGFSVQIPIHWFSLWYDPLHLVWLEQRRCTMLTKDGDPIRYQLFMFSFCRVQLYLWFITLVAKTKQI